MGARQGYHPQHRGKKSYPPILTFLAETRESVGGEWRKGDWPTGKPIAAHLERVLAALPESVERVYARADSGCCCGPAVAAYRQHGCRFGLCAQKTPRLVAELPATRWRGVAAHRRGRPVCVSLPAGRWGRSLPVGGLAPGEGEQAAGTDQPAPYQLCDTPEYTYRVFGTDLDAAIDVVVGFYRQRGGAENLIQAANHDAGWAAHPAARWAMHCVHFQLAMLAYNLNCWLLLCRREEQAQVEDLRHTTLATARLRFLFLAAKIVRHAGTSWCGTAIITRSRGRARGAWTGGAMELPSPRFAPVLASALRL